MKKILLIANSSWNIYNFRKELINLIIEKKYKLIISCPDGKYIDKLSNYNLDYLPINYKRHSINIIENIKIIYFYLKIIYSEKPSVIITYTIKPNIFFNLSAFISLRKLKILNFITGIGNIYFEKKIKKIIIFILYKIALFKSDKVIFQNVYDMQYFVKNKLVNKSKCVLIQGSGINTKLFKYKPLRKNTNSDLVFLCISRLILHKGINEYIKAAIMVKKKYPKTKFILVGSIDKEYQYKINQNLLSQSKSYIEHLEFTNDIIKLLESCDCFILPSYREGTSRSLLEAASVGRPIITSDVPGCNNIVIDNYNGYLCKPMDEISLYENINKMINTSLEMRNKMSLNARKIVETNFESSIINKQILKIMDL